VTPLQHKRFYLPAWTRCARANNWHNLGALRLPPRDVFSPLGTELLTRVRDVADQLARADHRAVRPDDFRHACHIVALGKNKSSLDLVNAECGRIVTLFRVLADPDDLEAVLDWENPERAEKRNLIAAAWHKAPEAYVRHLLRYRFHSANIENLSLGQLRQLCMTLSQRREAWRKPVEVEAPF